LIHLIDMTGRRRVQWAGMEFLRQSRKRNRARVLFKQLLLLLLRMTALAAVVLLMAQPRVQGRWGRFFAGARTHHIVLLDDSFSMSDRWKDTDAFSEAKKALGRIAAEAARQTGVQTFTLLRFSRAARPMRPTKADWIGEPVGGDFADRLEALCEPWRATQTAVGPLAALKAASQWLDPGDGRRCIVYLISDFRAREWGNADELRRELLKLNAGGAEIRLLNCVDRTRPNLAIVALKPAEGVRTAGIPWFVDVSVANFGAEPARNVAVALSEDGRGRPGIGLGEIPPGRAAAGRFLVNFPAEGLHEIAAHLESDAVEADNHRFLAVDLTSDVPVLIVDGDAQARGAGFLSLAMSPGGAVRTGLRPRIETPRYLSLHPLDTFAAVNLSNVDRLDASAVQALEAFVAAGGGAAFFLGDRCDPAFYNETLYRDGRGLFPLPLARETELPVDRLDPAPDVHIDEHFIFRVFSGGRSGLAREIGVQRHWAVPKDWRPPADSTVRVVARLRNGAPWVVEREFGKGRVVAFLTPVAPPWSNWARTLCFAAVVQDLQAYVSNLPSPAAREVGSPLAIELDPTVYRPEVRFQLPESAETTAVTIHAEANAAQPPSAVTDNGARPPSAVPGDSSRPGAAGPHQSGAAGLEGSRLTAALTDTDAAGFYRTHLNRIDGKPEIRLDALNVDSAEGNLAAVSPAQLAAQLEGVAYQYRAATDYQAAAVEAASHHLGDALLYGLIALLIAEQLLAWSASYHPASRGASSVRGGRAAALSGTVSAKQGAGR